MLKLLVLLPFLFGVLTAQNTSYNTPYDNFRLIFGNVSTLQPYDMDQIVAQILAQVSCTDNPSVDCYNCLRSSILQASGLIGTTVDRREFGNVSLVVFCYLLDLRQYCAYNQVPDYSRCLNSITNGKEYLDVTTLDDLINKVSSIYHVSNNYFTNNVIAVDLNCIEAGPLIAKYSNNQLAVSGTDNINNLFAEVVFMMYNRMKIGCSIPYANWFIDQLYLTYNSVSDNIGIQGLKQVINDMSLTQPRKKTKSSYSITLFKRSPTEPVVENSLKTNDVELLSRSRRSTSLDDQYNRCYSAEEIMQIFSLGNSTINKFDFHTICPSLIYMKVTGSCLNAHMATSQMLSSNSSGNGTAGGITQAEKYGIGTACIFLVSVLALLGIFLLPCFKKKHYQDVLTILSALAVSTLLCDAVLHILPEILGLETEGESSDEPTPITVPGYTIKLTVAIITLYLLWVSEKILHHIATVKSGGAHGHGHGHGHSHGFDLDSEEQSIESSENIVNSANEKPKMVESIVVDPQSGAAVADSSTTQITGEANVKKSSNDDKINLLEQLKTFYKIDFKKIHALAWMILASDAIHNFADGMAVGASFSESLSLGVSTTIAIVCHEIPHELGNYAVLVKCGFTHIQALLFNLLSACSAFIGFYVGASVSADPEVSAWIFTVTAGMFFYIALVDILPTVMSGPRWSWTVFILCNVAMFFGFAVMFLLVVFEDHIKI